LFLIVYLKPDPEEYLDIPTSPGVINVLGVRWVSHGLLADVTLYSADLLAACAARSGRSCVGVTWTVLSRPRISHRTAATSTSSS